MRRSSAESRPSGGARWRVYAVTVASVAIVAMPATWFDGHDSFPISTYPMFAYPRASTMSVATVVGVEPDGKRVTLSPEAIAGAGWVNMAARLVRDTVRSSATAQTELCEAVADRVAAAGDPTIAHVEVVRETFDTVAYFVDTPTPSQRHTYARCPVPR